MPLTFIMAFDDELSLKVISESEERIGFIAKAISGKQKSIKKPGKGLFVEKIPPLKHSLKAL